MAKPSTGWNTSPTTSTAVDDNNERRGSSGALVFSGTINPGKVFDRDYAAMRCRASIVQLRDRQSPSSELRAVVRLSGIVSRQRHDDVSVIRR